MSDNDETDDDWDYESGPFCMHWSELAECERVCICGHGCSDHDQDEPHGCEVDNCCCKGFTDANPED